MILIHNAPFAYARGMAPLLSRRRTAILIYAACKRARYNAKLKRPVLRPGLNQL